jgi:poly(A) polymerase
MTSGPTRKIMAAFETARPGGAMFVGGCVRDALMGRPVSDIDIATQLPPDAVADVMRSAGFAVHPTGIEHGTLTIVVDHQPFEVTTLRRDVETDGRRATVAFTEDWAEDARRRDFRMNALYASIAGDVLDPTGGGLADIDARRVIFVGEADMRIREDYLRILRFFRFSAWFATPPLDAVGLDACALRADGLAGLSAERVWAETRKLLAAPDPRTALFAMDAAGVLGRLYPWAKDAGRLAALVGQDVSEGFAPDPLLRLLSLSGGDAQAIEMAIRSLKLSNAEAGRLRRAMRARPLGGPEMSDHDLRLALYQSGQETVLDLIRLAWAGESGEAGWRAMHVRAQDEVTPALPVTGADIVARGVPPGPDVGRWLSALEQAWIASDFRDEREVLLDRLTLR